MPFDWSKFGTDAAEGALSGAGTGAAIGGPWGALIGGLGGLALGGFEGYEQGSASGNLQDQAAAQQAAYQKLLAQGYQTDPQTQAAIDQLTQLSQTGLGPQDIAAFREAQAEGEQGSRAQQMAIANALGSRNSGVANTGMGAALASGAAQGSMNQAARGQLDQAAVAAQRRQQASEMLTQLMAQQDQAKNQWKLEAMGGMQGAAQNYQRTLAAQQEAQSQGYQSLLNTGLGIAAYGSQKGWFGSGSAGGGSTTGAPGGGGGASSTDPFGFGSGGAAGGLGPKPTMPTSAPTSAGGGGMAPFDPNAMGVSNSQQGQNPYLPNPNDPYGRYSGSR